MIEAFEIGVSLALRDGVSASISLAQSNLLAFEKAISASGIAIQSLRDAGSRAASIPVEASRHQPPTSPSSDKVKSVRLTEPVDRVFGEQVFAAREAEKSGQLDTKAFLAIATSVNRATQSQALTTVSMPVVQQAPSPLTSVDGKGDAAATEAVADDIYPRQANLPSSPSIPAGSTPESDAVAPGHAPHSLVQPVLMTMPSTIPLQLPQISKEGVAQGSFNAQDLKVLRFSDFAENSFSAIRTPDAQAYPEPWQSSDGYHEVRPKETSIAQAPFLPSYAEGSSSQEISHLFIQDDGPIEADRRPWREYSPQTSRAADKPSIADQRQSDAPRAQRRESQAPSGNVYLDGMLVGRWVSRFLLKQAERADAGPTGFDAKRGRLLPGVTVGG